MSYTLLETVNFVLAQVGVTALPALGSNLPDENDALLRINEALVKTLKRGWWFNRDRGVELVPDDQDNYRVALPTGTMKILRASPCYLVPRGGFAYDPYEQTDEFPDVDKFTLDLVIKLDYEDCPYSAQDVIRIAAAQSHIRIELEDESKASALNGELQAAVLEMKRDDIEVMRRNMAYSPKFIRTRGGVRPYKFGGRTVNPNYPGG